MEIAKRPRPLGGGEGAAWQGSSFPRVFGPGTPGGIIPGGVDVAGANRVTTVVSIGEAKLDPYGYKSQVTLNGPSSLTQIPVSEIQPPKILGSTQSPGVASPGVAVVGEELGPEADVQTLVELCLLSRLDHCDDGALGPRADPLKSKLT